MPRIEGHFRSLLKTSISHYTYSLDDESAQAKLIQVATARHLEVRRDEHDSFLVDHLRLILSKNLAKLTACELNVLRTRYGIRGTACTLNDVAAALHISRWKVIDCIRRGLLKLRTAIERFAFRRRMSQRDAQVMERNKHVPKARGGKHRRRTPSAWGQWVLSMARQRGIDTYEQLAEALNTNPYGVGQWLQRQDGGQMKKRTVDKLCSFFGVDREMILTGWRNATLETTV